MIENLEALLPNPEGPSFQFSPAGTRCLEIGGGPHARRLSFRQFDARDWKERTGLTYELGDARALPYEANSFDHVYCSNLLEHFNPLETARVLQEWARILRLGGLIEIIVPDAMGILAEYFWDYINAKWSDCQERLLGSDDYEGNQHRTAFTISTFPAVIAEARAGLGLIWCKPCHNNCGIYALAQKTS